MNPNLAELPGLDVRRFLLFYFHSRGEFNADGRDLIGVVKAKAFYFVREKFFSESRFARAILATLRLSAATRRGLE
jgi:hypothetical protein